MKAASFNKNNRPAADEGREAFAKSHRRWRRWKRRLSIEVSLTRHCLGRTPQFAFQKLFKIGIFENSSALIKRFIGHIHPRLHTNI